MRDAQNAAWSGNPKLSYAACFFLSLVTALAVRFQSVPAAIGGALQDPDSYMRLVRIQAALDEGRWFGALIPRDASGAGFVQPWSHLLDALILMLRLPLRLAMPPDSALFWAAIATGPLLMGALGAAAAWAVAPLASRKWLWTASFGVAVAPAVLNYGELGFVTHHIALAAVAVGIWGAAGRAAIGDRRNGLWLGVLAGAGIWISPEAMPFGMMGLGAVLLAWAVEPRASRVAALSDAGIAFVATLGFGLLADPPPAGWLAVEVDRLSLCFLVLGGIVCAVCCTPRIPGLSLASWQSRFGWLAAAITVGATVWLSLFPGFASGLAGLMTADEAAAFFGRIEEMAPLNTANSFTLYALAGTLGSLACIALAAFGRERPLQRALWLYAGGCGVVCVGLAVQHLRFSIYPAAASATVLPALLERLSTGRLAAWRPLLRPALLAGFLCAPGLVGRALVPGAQAREDHDLRMFQGRCLVRDAAPLLRPLGAAVVLADVDDGPELLYRSPVRVVGSLYHPDIAGFMRLRAAWRERETQTLPASFAATRADFVLICPHRPRMPLVDGPTTTLFDRLNADDPPGWLHKVAADPGSAWVIYRVDPAS